MMIADVLEVPGGTVKHALGYPQHRGDRGAIIGLSPPRPAA
jgi:hypothetical protein